MSNWLIARWVFKGLMLVAALLLEARRRGLPGERAGWLSPMRVLQGLFLVVAVEVVYTFARTAMDGERRHAPEVLVAHLNPNYTGNNRLAPDFELADRAGHRVNLHDYRGRTVVLHFWTRTCQPCVEELQNTLPAFDELVRNRRDVVLLMVTVDANWEAIAPLVPNDFRAAMLFDPDRRIVTQTYGTTQFPETWVIDREGVIRARFDHALPWGTALWMDYLAAL